MVLNSVTFLVMQKCESLFWEAQKRTNQCMHPSSLNSILYYYITEICECSNSGYTYKVLINSSSYGMENLL